MKSHQFGLGLVRLGASGVGIHRSLALLVLWLVGTATIAQGAHYQFRQQCAPQTHSLSVVRGLANGDNRIILTQAAMEAAWSALRELPDAQPWAA